MHIKVSYTLDRIKNQKIGKNVNIFFPTFFTKMYHVILVIFRPPIFEQKNPQKSKI